MFVGSALTDLLPAILLLFVIAIVGSVVILRLRKSIKSPPDRSMPFSLHSLRKLRDEGAITEEEFEKAKQSVIDHAKPESSDIHDESQ